MTLRACRGPLQAIVGPAPRLRLFSTTTTRRDQPSNHYETLNVPLNASPGDIKKQFYSLSKSHHPDLHPNDPDASSRFVKISEAYAVLGSAEKRAAYDRTITPAAAQHHPRGSYSSHTANVPAGGRPPSGLSRRKTQFRGPPPSFYRSGGWGEHAAKRAEHAARPRTEHDRTAQGREEGDAATGGYTQAEPGMGPGGFATGADNDVPHFDREGHFRTQEGVAKARHRSRRPWITEQDVSEAKAAGNSFTGFLAISGVLAIILGLSSMIDKRLPTSRVDPVERKKRQTG
ncbi:hypothetical protein ANO11243_022730 [Dothideomycetidae sp. 11243]|nr:hypothetical protein ANO11243_022730 [fungal sp. No.11243]